MSDAKVVSLSVMASKASLLCFEVGGILGRLNVELGSSVNAFDFAGFYATIGSTPTVVGHPARLVYDFLEIQAAVASFTIAELRAESAKAILSKAINGRANAYYAKHINAPDIISRMNELYSPSIIGSKPQRLATLSSISESQMAQLRNAYQADGRTQVVKTTQSKLKATSQSNDDTMTMGQSDADGLGYRGAPGTLTAIPAGGTSSVTVSGDLPVGYNFQMEESSSTAHTKGTATELQTIVNTDYGYRIPYLENAAQYERAQISLIDEQFTQFMFAQNLPYMAAVFQNELNSMDGDVFRLQIAYLNTILMSPVAGTVTGIYKNPGEAVKPGEPVIRVEDNSDVLVAARLVYRQRIAIGSTVTITTNLFDSSQLPTKRTGTVVAVRGLLEDDQWEAMVKCSNLDGGGNPIFPLGYRFDYDNTTVAIA
jgi:hypothetical protein